MSNVTAAQRNIGGALCSTPQSLADANNIGWQWRNFLIAAVFRHFVGQALRNRYSDVSRRHFLNKIAIVRTFLKQIQFYSNNATDLHHLTTHSTTCWPTKWWSHCDHRYMTSLHPMYTGVPCSNAAKTRNPLTFARVPQTNETISAASGPKFTTCGGDIAA